MKQVGQIMIVGSDKIYAIENFYVKHLRNAGIIINHFAAQTIFYDYYYKNILHKLLFKAGISGISKHINHLFLEEVAARRPDVVWVFKGMEIMPSSLEKVRKMGIALVNYNPDNPFIFTGKGSGNQFVTDSIGLYDLHFTYNLAIKKLLEEKHAAATAWLPFGFEISEDLFNESAAQPEIIKACFLGNPDKQRSRFLDALAMEGVEIDVYGNDWHKFVQHKGIKIFEPVYGNDLWMVLRRYRVQLNLMRIHNEDSHNMRSFEVPGIGGIMLSPDTIEHRVFYEDGKEVFLFKDVRHCARLTAELLRMPVEKANAVRTAARKRSLESGYSYKDRAGFALRNIQTIYG